MYKWKGVFLDVHDDRVKQQYIYVYGYRYRYVYICVYIDIYIHIHGKVSFWMCTTAEWNNVVVSVFVWLGEGASERERERESARVSFLFVVVSKRDLCLSLSLSLSLYAFKCPQKASPILSALTKCFTKVYHRYRYNWLASASRKSIIDIDTIGWQKSIINIDKIGAVQKFA